MIAEYKEQFPSDEYKITRLLDKISLMTPENIHINTFMYEPLIDMSIIHLVKLYELVKSEKDRIEQLQFNEALNKGFIEDDDYICDGE